MECRSSSAVELGDRLDPPQRIDLTPSIERSNLPGNPPANSLGPGVRHYQAQLSQPTVMMAIGHATSAPRA